MNKINYDEFSKIYDEVRRGDLELINAFLEEIEINETTTILDIGCGTGNYTHLVAKVTRGKVFGVEPSAGMLQKARLKSPGITFRRGRADRLPFEESFFDFVYMTDVIHHVPDIGAMFSEISRVSKAGGKVCIATQSHQQIATRPIVRFFPETAGADKARYPDIDRIIAAAEQARLPCLKTVILGAGQEIELDRPFLELVRKRGYSMLHLISEQAYARGLGLLEEDLRQGSIRARASGATLVWLVKK